MCTHIFGRIGSVSTSLFLQCSTHQHLMSRDNNNDYILVIPTDAGTARPLGTAIDVNQDRLHILGIGYKPAPMGYNGLTFDGYVSTAQDTEIFVFE